ncbi:MAG: DNA polymerase, partial [Candidatus Dojkabacteria bacterium]|nr:DNA polymerase [Candidatus Dojkabacteria bacterium]
YAFPTYLVDPNNRQINAVYGFFSILCDVLVKFNPTHIIAVFDSEEGTFKKSTYYFYKANRNTPDPMLLQQIPILKELLDAFSIRYISYSGYEADDVIATVVDKFYYLFEEIIIVTSDQDLFQLIDKKGIVKVFLSSKKFADSRLFSWEEVFEKIGVYPNQIADYKSLAGDPSDNIPGVSGIGQKTAIQLLLKYGNLENLIANLDNLSIKLKQKISIDYEQMIKSHELAKLNSSLPLDIDDNYVKFVFNSANILKKFKELRFYSLIKKIENLSKIYLQVQNYNLDGISNVDIGFHNNNKKIYNLFGYVLNEVYSLNGLKNLFTNIQNYPIFLFFYPFTTSSFIGNIDYLVISSLNNKNHLYKINTNITEFFLYLIDKKKEFITINIHSLLYYLLKNNVDINYLYWQDPFLLKNSFHFENYSINKINDFYYFFDILYSIYNDFINIISNNDKLSKIYEIEKKVTYTIINMQHLGIKIDVNLLNDNIKILDHKINSIQNEINEIAGYNINLKSNREIAYLLHQKRGLPLARKGKLYYKTDEASLKPFLHSDPIIEKILEYREASKILNTFLLNLKEFLCNDGRIHAFFDQNGTITGRLSCKNPNLQNLPKKDVFQVNVKQCFIPDNDNVFVAFDYSQQELRVLAGLAKENNMISAFNNKLDIHKLTAAGIMQKNITEVTDDDRELGKQVNYSIIYGMSPFALSQTLNISFADAKNYINSFFNMFPKLNEYYNKVIASASVNLYTETIFGRRRYNRKILSQNLHERLSAERELFNFVIQGSAADIMKLLLAKLYDTTIVFDTISIAKFLVLQVHDEIVFEIPNINVIGKNNFYLFLKQVYLLMTQIFDIGVSFEVECKVGSNLNNMQIVNLQNL